MLAIFSQDTDPPPENNVPAEGDAPRFREIGTAATVVRMAKSPDGSVHAILQGAARIRLVGIENVGPPITARVQRLLDEGERSLELEAVMRDAVERFLRVVSLSDTLPNELGTAVADITDAGRPRGLHRRQPAAEAGGPLRGARARSTSAIA